MFRSVLAVAAVAGLTAAAPAGAPDYFAEKEKDFGVTGVGPVLVHYFPIKNTTNQKVVLGTPRIQCGCVSVTLMKAELAPGETTHLIAYMNTAKIPAAQIGTTKAVAINVPSLAPTLEEVTLTVKCLANPNLFWSTQDGVSFGTVTKGKSAKASMTVTLFGNPTWEVKEVTSSGAYVTAEAKRVVDPQQPNLRKYEITATLKDACPKGNWMSDLTVKTNAPGIESMRIPVTVNVENPIRTFPEAVDVGTLPMGGSKTVEVKVSGLEKFKVLEVKGAEDGVSVKPTTEGARQFHTLSVEVKAAAAGKQDRKIEIVTDSKEMPSIILPVSYTAAK